MSVRERPAPAAAPPAPPAPPASPRLVPPPIRRLREWTAAAALVALAFSQQPGLVVGDTKADLVLDPGGFLGRALRAWDPAQGFGQLANQSYGYLWPMGPFFWLGHAAGVPAWVVQRSWWALLLVVAYAGTLRLAGALGLGTPTTRMVGAVAYAVSPRVLSVLGSISVEALPLAVVPWVLLPLVRGARGDLQPRRAAALSGLAVACAGGVNAAASLAVLPLPALFLLTRPRGSPRLAAWWGGAVALATAWWVLPLLVLGRYAYPFLDHIENASVTTSVTTVANTLRGTSHWLAYLVVHGGPRWPGGFDLAVSPLPVVATAAVAAAGLAGLLGPRWPGGDRRWLLLGVLLGTVVVAAGHAGTLTGPLAPAVRDLLDGPLAPFRNVHKFDPLIRLPLALGLVHGLALAARAAGRAAAAGRAGTAGDRPDAAAVPGRSRARRTVVGLVAGRPGAVRAGLGLAVVAALGLSAAPAWGGRLAPDGGYAALPAYWRDAAAWLAARSGPGGDVPGGRALLVPSANFGDYLWGSPVDEPLQALARSPWAVRDAVPLGEPGATRLLDAVDARLATGQPSAVLAPVLARAGVRWVVLRNDVDPLRSGSERPGVVRAALAGSPGIALAASFGPRRRTSFTALDTVLGGDPGVPAVEVFAVTGSGDPRAVAYPRAGSVAVSGGPEAALPLAGAGLLAGRALVSTVDVPGPEAVGAVAVTDTLRRRSLNFGGDPGRRYSPTLPASEDPAAGRPAGDVAGSDAAHQSVGVLDGAAAVTASSSGADPFAAAYRGPDRRPAAAYDGDPGTAWISDAGTAGEWLELALPGPVAVGAMTVSFVDDPAVGPPVTRVRVGTDAGERVVPVRAGEAPQRVPLPPGATTRVRITVDAVGSTAPGGAVGVREVAVPGVVVAEAVALPADADGLERAGLPWTVVVERAAGRRGDCVRPDRAWACVPGLAAAGEEVTGLDRRFRTATAADVTVVPTVRARPGAALDALLDAALGYRASASSAVSADPVARAGAAYDGDPATAWIPAGSDAVPQLRLDLGSTVLLRGVRLAGSAADWAGVGRLVLTAGGERRELRPRAGADQRFAPVRARQVTLTLERVAGRDGVLAPVRVPDVLLAGAPARPAGLVELPCGSGPPVGLDGALVRTAVTATVADLQALATVRARPCAGPVPLAPGEHRLVGGSVPAAEVAGATVAGGSVPAVGSVRAVTVESWSAESRRVRVGDGDAGYLALTEGFNAGWRATAGGRDLAPVRLDGWRQAWVLPAGTGAVVELTYAPGRWHRAGLLTGLAALLALAALARPRRGTGRAPADGAAPSPAAPRWRWTRRAAGRAPADGAAPSPAAPRWRWTRRAAGRAPADDAAVVDGGGSPSGEMPGVHGREGARWGIVAVGGTLGVGLVLAGAAGVLAALAALAVPARHRAAAAGGLLAAAGLVLGLAPTWAAQPALVQLSAVAAVALAAAALSDVDRPAPLRGRRGPAPAQPVGEPERRPLQHDP